MNVMRAVIYLLLVAALVVPVPAAPPVANFVGTPVLGAKPLTVQFNDTSTNTPTSWLWDFGDGETSTVKNASHTYLKLGEHDVTLTATNGDGSDSELKNGYINVTPAMPRLMASAVVTITMNEAYATQLMEVVGGNSTYTPGDMGLDALALLATVRDVLFERVGELGMVIVFSLPFIMMLITQRNIIIPCVVGIVLGLFIIIRLPGSYQLFAVSAIAIGVTGLVYTLYKER